MLQIRPCAAAVQPRVGGACMQLPEPRPGASEIVAAVVVVVAAAVVVVVVVVVVLVPSC